MQVIREILDDDKFVVAVEHDLSVLDYLSDFVCCLYGKPGAYGVVTMPASVRDGLNIFLAGAHLLVPAASGSSLSAHAHQTSCGIVRMLLIKFSSAKCGARCIGKSAWRPAACGGDST
jgi:hypothetical protein